ncbi:MatE family protein [Histomonas meleagridis]|uniref:MatE family protein n=1 Tax=Histomonas meleagridis TaxID=135588 RepID=UPI0035594AEC|nr:MatE family protein [Histomonas meleagridis]KAH0803422.1 MatE family protein [Histomonas meleagridis]
MGRRRVSSPLLISNPETIASLQSSNIESNFSKEDKELGSKPPLRTFLSMSVGPLISQLVQAVYGIADSLWVASTIGSEGISVFGAVFIVEFLAIAVSNFLCIGLAIRVSYLYGEARGEEVPQLYIDYIRCCVILGIIVPCIILPITRPLVEWFGASKHLSLMCLQYMIPITAACFFKFLYMMNCGLLQAQGRSFLYGAIQIGALVVNMCVFDPIFLKVLRLPIWGDSLARIISEAIPGIVLTFLVFLGKFTIKVEPKMFLNRFSKETWPAFKVGFATFVSLVSYSIPLVLMQKFVNEAAISMGVYDDVIEVWSVNEKLYQIVGGSCDALALGLLPCASYAYGSGRMNRLLKLFLHSLWVSTLLAVTFSVILIFFPSEIASLWSKDPQFLYWAKQMIPKTFYLAPFIAYQYCVPALLQSLQKIVASTVLSITTQLLPLPVFSTVLYFTNKHDPARILYSYALGDAFAFILCTAFLIKPLRVLLKAKKDEELDDSIALTHKSQSDTALLYTIGSDSRSKIWQ